MLRLMGLLGIVVLCTAFGYSFSTRLFRRITNLKEMRKLVEILQGEVRYAISPLGEAIKNTAKHASPVLQTFFLSVAEDMEQRDGRTLEEIFGAESKMLLTQSALEERDIQMLVQMGAGLGYLDVQMQVKTMEYYLEELKKACAMAEEEYREKGKLYRSLGFMGGLFLAVVLL